MIPLYCVELKAYRCTRLLSLTLALRLHTGVFSHAAFGFWCLGSNCSLFVYKAKTVLQTWVVSNRLCKGRGIQGCSGHTVCNFYFKLKQWFEFSMLVGPTSVSRNCHNGGDFVLRVGGWDRPWPPLRTPTGVGQDLCVSKAITIPAWEKDFNFAGSCRLKPFRHVVISFCWVLRFCAYIFMYIYICQ